MLPLETPYYWLVDESEWASDVMFRKQEELAQLNRDIRSLLFTAAKDKVEERRQSGAVTRVTNSS